MVTILSGTEFGYTLGTPIGLFVKNEDQRPGDYKEMSTIPRPGHADWTYLLKYGTKASSGGGRSSARETIGRVAAGAIAEKWLNDTYGTEISCWVSSIGDVQLPESAVPRTASGFGWSREEVDKLGTLRMLRDPSVWKVVTDKDEPDAEKRNKANLMQELAAEDKFIQMLTSKAKSLAKTPCYEDWEGKVYNHEGVLLPTPADIETMRTDELLPLRCPHPPSAAKMATVIRQVKSEKDSIGGSVACVCRRVPPALGEPVFDRLEAKMAHAMMSLPATKGFEIGSGFGGTSMRGSEHNDPFVARDQTNGQPSGDDALGNAAVLGVGSNHAGGTLGGISSGAPIYFKVAVKAVSTIGHAQTTADLNGEELVLSSNAHERV